MTEPTSPQNAARPAAVAEALRKARDAFFLLKINSSLSAHQLAYIDPALEQAEAALAALAQPSVEAPAAVEVSRLIKELKKRYGYPEHFHPLVKEAIAMLSSQASTASEPAARLVSGEAIDWSPGTPLGDLVTAVINWYEATGIGATAEAGKIVESRFAALAATPSPAAGAAEPNDMDAKALKLATILDNEWYGWLGDDVYKEAARALRKFAASWAEMGGRPVPSEAQKAVAREPLTEEQMRLACPPVRYGIGGLSNFMAGVRFAEEHHGIRLSGSTEGAK